MATTRRGVSTAPPNATMSSSPSSASTTRNSPFLPTPLERTALAIFPTLLIFGTIFSMVSPQTRSAPYDPITQSHTQDPGFAPSYFARKSNVFNVLFVKQGWAWVTIAFTAFLLTHPSTTSPSLRFRAGIRYVGVTACWFLMTQWCFGAPIIDRGFRWTGGTCEIAEMSLEFGDTSVGEMVTSMACKAAGGKWKGGHDISGHVFLLVLATAFLMEEVGWSMLRFANWGPEERSVIMSDGATKGAGIEAEIQGRGFPGFGFGGRFAVAVIALNVWMLLMTAIYFHTWFEKFTGLLTALLSWYIIYVVPRFVPGLRKVVGQPGI